MNILHLKQRGDTIIEVMMVLAVLGLAISIAYATANQSLMAARQAQENSQAAAILRSQIELMRTLSSPIAGSPVTIYSLGSSKFCINQDDATLKFSDCKFDDLYNVSIVHKGENKFELEAAWEDVRGEGTNRVTYYYRVYPSP